MNPRIEAELTAMLVDPRFAANEALRDTMYVLERHPSLSQEQVDILSQAANELRRIAND